FGSKSTRQWLLSIQQRAHLQLPGLSFEKRRDPQESTGAQTLFCLVRPIGRTRQSICSLPAEALPGRVWCPNRSRGTAATIHLGDEQAGTVQDKFPLIFKESRTISLQ